MDIKLFLYIRAQMVKAGLHLIMYITNILHEKKQLHSDP